LILLLWATGSDKKDSAIKFAAKWISYLINLELASLSLFEVAYFRNLVSGHTETMRILESIGLVKNEEQE
jgi:hypothetical protein